MKYFFMWTRSVIGQTTCRLIYDNGDGAVDGTILFKKEITEEEARLSLKDLAEKYSCPEVE